MWTYMMAASRGERANMMNSSRRRTESESPKYGYNPSRPMYRTARHNATSSAYPPYSAMQYDSSHSAHSSSTTAPHGSGSTATTATVLTSHSGSPPLFNSHHRPAPHCIANEACEYNNSHDTIGEEDGTSLYSPLSPSATMTVDKEAHIFACRSSKCKPVLRKQLIANHVDAAKDASVRMSVQESDGDFDGEDDTVGFVSAYERSRRRHLRRMRQSKCENIENDDDEEDEGDEEDDDDDESDYDEYVKRAGAAGAGASRSRRHMGGGGIGDEAEMDYVELENGKRLSKDQNKRAKPSTLRRTLNALRQRLTRRSRSKPPDWFLEKFSNTSNNDKIGKTNSTTASATATGAPANPQDAGLSSEIRGTSALCNRLSVNPTLQSHYRWLGIVSLAVLYNIIFVVGRAVFWEINQRAAPVWYFLDYLCDSIYLVDTLVHMHEGYLDQGLLVRDAYKLRRHYFSTKGWSIDLLSMLPTDLAYIWWSPNSCSSTFLPCAVIVRLNRLLRLPRMWEWFDRTETATGYPNAFRICKVVLAILVLIHWNACMYFAISYALGFGTDNWVYNLNGYRNATLQRQYIYSFYWSTLTLTTIGETPTPENDAEYIFVVADFLAGVLIFATIVGNIGSMISNMNVARVEFQNRMDGVKQYMAFRKVGHELEARVIRWFAYTWSQSGALDEERVLAALPDKLKAEIAIQVHMDTLKQVRIFHDCEPGLLEALVLKLKLQVFSPGDYICRKGDVGKEMYIVKRGKLSVVADDGVTVFATLGAGSVFGEVSVLEIAGNRTGNRRTANVRSLGYSDLFCLAKRDLWETLGDYPEARATLTERGCQLLRKDGLLDEQVFSDSQRVHDSIESGIEKLEMSVENLNVRLARLLAEYTASQAKLKQRLAKLEARFHLTNSSNTTMNNDAQTRPRSGRLYSLQPKKRPRARPLMASKSIESKQNTL